MNSVPPYDNNVNFLAIATVILGSITHWTANGVAAFFTAGAGFTAMAYNAVKLWEWWQKRKLVHRYEKRQQKK